MQILEAASFADKFSFPDAALLERAVGYPITVDDEYIDAELRAVWPPDEQPHASLISALQKTSVIFGSDSARAAGTPAVIAERAHRIAVAARRIILESGYDPKRPVAKADDAFLFGGLLQVAKGSGVSDPIGAIDRAIEGVACIEQLFGELAQRLRDGSDSGPLRSTRSDEPLRNLYLNLAICYERHWQRPAAVSRPKEGGGETAPGGPFIRFLQFTVGRITGNQITTESLKKQFDRSRAARKKTWQAEWDSWLEKEI